MMDEIAKDTRKAQKDLFDIDFISTIFTAILTILSHSKLVASSVAVALAKLSTSRYKVFKPFNYSSAIRSWLVQCPLMNHRESVRALWQHLGS